MPTDPWILYGRKLVAELIAQGDFDRAEETLGLLWDITPFAGEDPVITGLSWEIAVAQLPDSNPKEQMVSTLPRDKE
mgnify:FL=1